MQVFSFVKSMLLDLFGKAGNWRQMHKQTSVTFYKTNNVYLQNNVLKKEKNMCCLTTSLLII